MKISKLLPLLLLPLFLLACGGPQNPLANLVPSDSQVFVQIENPKTFMTNLDQFIKPLGLDQLTGKKTSGEWLDSIAKDSSGMIDPLWFDLEKPLGLAISGIGATSEPQFLIYLPLKDAAKNIKNLDKLAMAAEAKVVAADSYAVLAVNYKDAPTFPVKKALDFSVLSTLEKGGLSYYVDFVALKSAFGFNAEAVVQMLSSEMDASAGVTGAGALAMTKEMFKNIIGAVDQATHLHSALVADGAGLKSQAGVAFAADGSVAKWLKDVPKASGTSTLLKYLPAKALGNMVINLDPATLKKWSVEMNTWMFKLLEVDQAKVAEHDKLMAPLLDLMGAKSAVSFDLDYNMDEIKKMTDDPDSLVSGMEKAFSLKAMAVVEVKDGKAYAQASKAYLTSGIWQDLMKAVSKDSPLPVSFGFDYVADQKEGDFAYDKISFKVEAAADAEAQLAAGLSALTGLFKKLTAYLHYTSGKVYIVFGDNALADLKTLAAKDAVADSLADSKTLKSLAGYFPDNANVAGNFNLARVLQLVAKSGAPGMENIPVLSEDSPGFVGYAKLGNASVESGGAWALKEIGESVKGLLPLAQRLFMGGF